MAEVRVVTVTLSAEGATADDLAQPGTPYIGRGRTALEALGQWAWFHREQLGFSVELVTPKGTISEPRRPAS